MMSVKTTLGAAVVLLLCAFSFMGCEGSSASGEQVSQVVTEAGGEVVAPGGKGRLIFPPGALSEAREITVEVVSGTGVAHLVTDLLELGPSGIIFSVPVILEISVTGSLDGETPYLAKVVNGTPVPVSGATYDSAKGLLSGPLTSFSQYGGFVPPKPTQTDLEKCQECASTKCSSALGACENHDACDKLLECIEYCVNTGADSNDCIDSCKLLHPAGVSRFEAMASCTEENCPTCTGMGGSTPDFEDCQDCVNALCGPSLSACEENSSCNSILDCIGACVEGSGDTDQCIQSCVLLHPGGKVLFEAMSDCAEDKCPACAGEEGLTDEELCYACIDEFCPSQHLACQSLPSCSAILVCMESCSGAKMDECASDCIDSNPGGAALIGALGDCVDDHCPICTEVAGPRDEPWEDPDTGLIWQNPSAPELLDWMDAITYCNGLRIDGHMDNQRRWRLPKLRELRTLIRGCPATETGGSCNVDDDGCKGGISNPCVDESCQGCTPTYEDDKPVCMWPDALVGPCGDGMSRGVYWSILSTDVPGSRMYPMKWTVDFGHGEVSRWPSTGDGSTKFWVRCVR